VASFAVLVLLGASPSFADTIKLERTHPPKSFRFTHGGDPIELTMTVESEVSSPQGDEVALAVHDQKDRPLMTHPIPLARVKQGRDSVVFKPTVQTLASDVTEVIVEAVLLNAVRRGVPAKLGESSHAKLSYKVK
jgi:hypothetical protein